MNCYFCTVFAHVLFLDRYGCRTLEELLINGATHQESAVIELVVSASSTLYSLLRLDFEQLDARLVAHNNVVRAMAKNFGKRHT